MPIDYKKYPPDWKERRARILKRAGDKCEFCGVENKAIGCRDIEGEFHEAIKISKMDRSVLSCLFIGDEKIIKIVLTIAHLDNDPENWEVSDHRLKALCQKCHLGIDRVLHNQTRAQNRNSRSGQITML